MQAICIINFFNVNEIDAKFLLDVMASHANIRHSLKENVMSNFKNFDVERFNRLTRQNRAMLSMKNQVNRFLDQIIGDFEVFSIVDGKALTTKKMSFSKAMDELDVLAMCAGASNGMDIRRVVA